MIYILQYHKGEYSSPYFPVFYCFTLNRLLYLFVFVLLSVHTDSFQREYSLLPFVTEGYPVNIKFAKSSFLIMCSVNLRYVYQQ